MSALNRQPSAMFDIDLERVDHPGEHVTLRDVSGAQPVHVVLLRHLNCPFCQLHLAEVVRRRNELGRLVVVSFADYERTREYGLGLPAGVVVLRDGERRLYAAARADRGSLWSVLMNPRILGKVLILRARGIRSLSPREDGFQLGADLVFDVYGQLAWSYISQSSDDRPPVDAVVAAMQAARLGILDPQQADSAA